MSVCYYLWPFFTHRVDLANFCTASRNSSGIPVRNLSRAALSWISDRRLAHVRTRESFINFPSSSHEAAKQGSLYIHRRIICPRSYYTPPMLSSSQLAFSGRTPHKPISTRFVGVDACISPLRALNISCSRSVARICA